MQRILPAFLVVVLLALPASAVRAGGPGMDLDRNSSFSVGILGGGHLFAERANLGVTAAPDATAGANDTGLAGLRAAIGLRSWAAAEVEIIGMRTSDRTYQRRASILGYRLNAVAYLMPGNLRPFVLVGAGAIEVATTRADGPAGLVRDRDGEFHLGMGLDYRLLEHLALRMDARAVQLPGKQDWSLVTDLEASLAVSVVFGAGPRPSVASATPQAPAAVAGAPVPPPVAAAERPSLPTPREPLPPPAAALPAQAPAVPSKTVPIAPVPLPRSAAHAGESRRDAPSVKELLGRAKEIRFDGSASSKLSITALPLIGQLAEALTKNQNAQLEIVAHTASSGDAAKDLALSKRRADAVKNALVEREVGANRLLATGRGSAEPLAPNITRTGRRLNERVELRLWTSEKMVR